MLNAQCSLFNKTMPQNLSWFSTIRILCGCYYWYSFQLFLFYRNEHKQRAVTSNARTVDVQTEIDTARVHNTSIYLYHYLSDIWTYILTVWESCTHSGISVNNGDNGDLCRLHRQWRLMFPLWVFHRHRPTFVRLHVSTVSNMTIWAQLTMAVVMLSYILSIKKWNPIRFAMPVWIQIDELIVGRLYSVAFLGVSLSPRVIFSIILLNMGLITSKTNSSIDNFVWIASLSISNDTIEEQKQE